MKTIKMLVAVIGMMAMLLNTTFADTATPVSEGSFITPTVPIGVAIKGRQAVTSHLVGQVDHVEVSYTGNSVVGPEWRNNRYLGRDQLRQLGYLHDGSFAELRDSIAGVAYEGDVVQTPDGYYDVRALLVFYNNGNKVVMDGNGYLDIYRDNAGNLQVGEFQPYVSIPVVVYVSIPGQVSAAKWVGKNGRSQDLSVSWDGQSTTVALPTEKLENGFLLFADGNGSVTGYDLASADTLAGDRIYAVLGTTRSGDIEVLCNPQVIDAGWNQFNSYGNRIVGRFPLRELVFDNATTQAIQFAVPVWGGPAKGLSPSRMFLTPLFINGPSPMSVGKEEELTKNGDMFFLVIPAGGGYHLRTVFEGLTDWGEINY